MRIKSTDLSALWTRVEGAVDDEPTLARAGQAAFDINRDGTMVYVYVVPKGKRAHRKVSATGKSPEDATEKFVEELWSWVETYKKPGR